MAMTENQLDIIEAIAKNDMPAARRAARAALAEDTSKKNAFACKRLSCQLDPAINPDLLKLPRKVEGLLQAENPRESFIGGRYYISPREASLFEHIVRMRNVCEQLAEMRINYPNTTLLFGRSGTGKTTFGRYLACMLDLPFYYLNLANVVDSRMGSTSKNIAAVFDYIRTEPCVFMLDELDCIGESRQQNGDAGKEMNRVTITIMQELDRVSGRQVIIGATNRLDIIDAAILRRFSKHHEVTIPANEDEAKMVVRLLLNDAGIDYDRAEIFNWCIKHDDKPQAWLINHTIEAIARSIAQGTPFTIEEA